MKLTRPCVNGCTRINAEQQREPARAATGNLCSSCIGRLDRWLEDIPRRYAELPEYLLPSADLDRNPESKATKRPTAPVPVRLAALDLLDERLARIWLGTMVADERRGTLGTLLTIANRVRCVRNTDTRTSSYVITEADYLRNSLDELAWLDTIADDYTDLKRLHRELGDAIGQYPPRPVGYCKVVPPDLVHDHDTCDCTCHHGGDCDEQPCGPDWALANACGGALLPNQYTGVLCVSCGTRWGHDALRRLGLVIGETA